MQCINMDSTGKILAFPDVPLKLKTMITRAIAIMAAAFLLTGCGKKQEPAQPAVQTNTSVPSSQLGIPTTPTPVVVVTSPSITNTNKEPNLDGLSYAVHAWITGYHRVPKDFEEFAATANCQIPPPPPGKKYALGAKHHVILVDR